MLYNLEAMFSSRLSKIQEILERNTLEDYRLAQVKHAIYKEGISDYSQISTFSKEVRDALTKELGKVSFLECAHVETAPQVKKYLFRTRDDKFIETVRMSYKSGDSLGRNALCVSTQVGCALKCAFCATGKAGLSRNLSSDEIVDQFLYFRQQLLPVDSVSFMGMGEPFANQETFTALQQLTSSELVGMSPRKISVSTVGIVPGIRRLTKEFPQVNLAFSLHTPFEQQRVELMPITKTYSISEVMKALAEHVSKTNKKVFISYLMLADVTDSDEHAAELIKLIKEQGAKSYLFHVNLISFHPDVVAESTARFNNFQPALPERVRKFMNLLKRSGVPVTLRQSFGEEIQAACGQLRGRAGTSHNQ